MVYAVASFFWTGAKRHDATCRGVVVNVENPNDSLRFITDGFIQKELLRLGYNVKGKPLRTIDCERIERAFDSQFYVEHVQCYTCSDNRLRIDLQPVQPVLRVFDGNESYYINRAGKRVPASDGFFLDVPVVDGHFTKAYPATRLLPLVDYLGENPDVDNLVSAISVANPRNVYIVPKTTGLVVNLGDLDDLDKKFAKLKRFYREVLPVKGWDYYDTITLKWPRQIVATKRYDKPRLWVQDNAELGHEESPDPGQQTTAVDTTHHQKVDKKN